MNSTGNVNVLSRNAKHVDLGESEPRMKHRENLKTNRLRKSVFAPCSIRGKVLDQKE